MLLGSHKAADLQRDPRLLVHSIVTSREGTAGEFKVRGRAEEISSEAVQRGYAARVKARLGWDPVPGRFHLFRVDLADVAFVRYDHHTGDQFVTRWPAGGELVRRGTTPTSVGEPEPYDELLMRS